MSFLTSCIVATANIEVMRCSLLQKAFCRNVFHVHVHSHN